VSVPAGSGESASDASAFGNVTLHVEPGVGHLLPTGLPGHIRPLPALIEQALKWAVGHQNQLTHKANPSFFAQ